MTATIVIITIWVSIAKPNEIIESQYNFQYICLAAEEKWRALTSRIILVGLIVFGVVAYFCLLHDQSVALAEAIKGKMQLLQLNATKMNNI